MNTSSSEQLPADPREKLQENFSEAIQTIINRNLSPEGLSVLLLVASMQEGSDCIARAHHTSFGDGLMHLDNILQFLKLTIDNSDSLYHLAIQRMILEVNRHIVRKYQETVPNEQKH